MPPTRSRTTPVRPGLPVARAAEPTSSPLAIELDSFRGSSSRPTDYVAVQALVASGSGVSTLPALALQAHQNPSIRAHRIPGERRTVSVATYGKPPFAPAIDAFVRTLTAISESMRERVELDGHQDNR